jgi:hypothetical protein
MDPTGKPCHRPLLPAQDFCAAESAGAYFLLKAQPMDPEATFSDGDVFGLRGLVPGSAMTAPA